MTRILLADDSPSYRALLRISLQCIPGLEVIAEAQDGVEAVTMAGDLQPDLVLLDLSMPRMDGLEALPEIRRRSPATQVVVLSGVTAARDGAVAAGAAGFVPKGATVDEIEAAIRRATVPGPGSRGAGAPAPPVPRPADVDAVWTPVASSPSPTALVDLDGRVLRANAAMGALLGVPPGDLVGGDLACLQHEPHAAAELALFAAVAAGVRRSYRLDAAARHADGTAVPVTVTAWAADAAGRFVLRQCVDDTRYVASEDARRAAAATAERERRELADILRSAFDGASIGMAIVDLDGRFTTVNRALADIVGRDEADLLGRSFQEITHPADLEADLAVLREAADGHRDGYRMEKRYLRPDGSSTWVQLDAAVVRTPSGAPRLYVAQVQPIDERRRQEHELREALAGLQAANDELARSNEDLVRFASVASHDLSEPLRVITGFLQLLDRRLGPRLGDQERTWIGHVLGGADRMQALIDDLLAYARVGQGELRRTSVDLGQVAQACVAELAALAAETGGRVVVGELPVVDADPAHVRQLLANLIANGLKFHRDGVGSTVRVEAERHGSAWELVVVDDGIGIPPEHRARVFEVFQRLHSRDDVPGSGVGLSICRSIVERHGGTVALEGAPGEGTTVRCTLPDPT